MSLSTMRGTLHWVMTVNRMWGGVQALQFGGGTVWGAWHLDHTSARKRPRGGGRQLKAWHQVFNHNNWDDVEWDEAQEAVAREKVLANSEVTMSVAEVQQLEDQAAMQWDNFYGIHQNKFFKDRHWLFTEFPELTPHLAADSHEPGNEGTVTTSTSQNSKDRKDGSAAGEVMNAASNSEEVTEEKNEVEEGESCLSSIHQPTGDDTQAGCKKDVGTGLTKSSGWMGDSFPGAKSKFRVLEVGCGVGNTVFPILKTSIDENLFVYCCDFSSTAIDIVKESADYDADRCHAFVCDVTQDDWCAPFPPSSLDVIICIFVLSALNPNKLEQVVQRMASYLRPGGLLLFRDYGRYDMAQLRFKKGKCLADNFYVRGDGTRCYFFTQEEVREVMTQAGLVEVQNLADRRLQVNRGKQLTMYRVWVQAKYRKPL